MKKPKVRSGVDIAYKSGEGSMNYADRYLQENMASYQNQLRGM